MQELARAVEIVADHELPLLDLLQHEPPELDSPLLKLPNVICTPHVAGSSVEVWPRVVETCFANIQRVARGEPPQHLARQLD